jgi:hypothetical protein
MIKPPAYSKIKQPFLHPPTFLEYKDIRFLITDAPSINNMSTYINVKNQASPLITKRD